MVNDEAKMVLRTIIDGGTSPETAPVEWRQAEQLGEAGFDHVMHLVRTSSLDASALSTALRLMSHISRIHCVDRKHSLLELTIDLLNSGSREVRSVAAFMAVHTFQSMQQLSNLRAAAQAMEPRLRSVLASAVGGGLPPEGAVQRFLSGEPLKTDPDPIHDKLRPSKAASSDRRDLKNFALADVIWHPVDGGGAGSIDSGQEMWLRHAQQSERLRDSPVEVHLVGRHAAKAGERDLVLVIFRDVAQVDQIDLGSELEFHEFGRTLGRGRLLAFANRT